MVLQYFCKDAGAVLFKLKNCFASIKRYLKFI